MAQMDFKDRDIGPNITITLSALIDFVMATASCSSDNARGNPPCR
jgi:hypothetical protein